MTMTFSWQTILTAAAVLGAAVSIGTFTARLVRWFDRQKEQDRDLAAIREEQTLLTFGVLACLKGLKEQGCNGPVTEAIGKIEGHINRAAHNQKQGGIER